MKEVQLKARISKPPEYGGENKMLTVEVTEVIVPEGVGDKQNIILHGSMVNKTELTDLLLGERELQPLCKAEGVMLFQLGDRLNLYGNPYKLALTPSEASLIEKTDEEGTVLARYHWYKV